MCPLNIKRCYLDRAVSRSVVSCLTSRLMITIYPCINDGLEGNLWFSALLDEPNSFIFQIVGSVSFIWTLKTCLTHTFSCSKRWERWKLETGKRNKQKKTNRKVTKSKEWLNGIESVYHTIDWLNDKFYKAHHSAIWYIWLCLEIRSFVKDPGVWTGECVHKYKFICLMNAKSMVIKGPRFARTFVRIPPSVLQKMVRVFSFGIWVQLLHDCKFLTIATLQMNELLKTYN